MTEPETSKNPVLCDDIRNGVYVVIAAYNEATCIEGVICDVRERFPNVVVVDDGSSDETLKAIRRATPLALRHAINRGQGAALQTGIDFALKLGAQYIVTFDADGQHCVEDIPAMLAPIVQGECDITLGSRFLREGTSVPTARRITLRLGILFTRIFSRVSLTDTHNGFRAFSRRAAQRIDITIDRMAHASELIDQIHASGLPYKEVPVVIRYTDYSMQKGQSSRGAIQIAINYLVSRVLP